MKRYRLATLLVVVPLFACVGDAILTEPEAARVIELQTELEDYRREKVGHEITLASAVGAAEAASADLALTRASLQELRGDLLASQQAQGVALESLEDAEAAAALAGSRMAAAETREGEAISAADAAEARAEAASAASARDAALARANGARERLLEAREPMLGLEARLGTLGARLEGAESDVLYARDGLAAADAALRDLTPKIQKAEGAIDAIRIVAEGREADEAGEWLNLFATAVGVPAPAAGGIAGVVGAMLLPMLRGRGRKRAKEAIDALNPFSAGGTQPVVAANRVAAMIGLAHSTEDPYELLRIARRKIAAKVASEDPGKVLGYEKFKVVGSVVHVKDGSVVPLPAADEPLVRPEDGTGQGTTPPSSS